MHVLYMRRAVEKTSLHNSLSAGTVSNIIMPTIERTWADT